jgi:hypothetical protein
MGDGFAPAKESTMTRNTLFGGLAVAVSLVALPAAADGRGPHKDVPGATAGPRGVPELSAGAVGTAGALIAGGLLVLAGYRKKRRSPE